MRTLAFTLMSLVCSLALAATVYRWVDDQGVVHYSDQPHANADKIQVHAAQTYKPGAVETNAPAGGGAQSSAPPAPYRGCAIVPPGDDQAYTNVDSLTVVVHGGAPTGPQFVLSPVDRGTHTAQAQVKDAGGAVQCQTPPVTFHVQQNSILNPNNNRVTRH